ncbi:hypothetical protein RF679_01325 [Undibacterium cyanobacteriorum]|uniref:AB hydrolase-1 domain-containing protein n=1 Tax=Undibacterium cyanobacteriorum TaxID=3073561 RepID=A0ABY9RKQ7_9BURK|nr:hypothetical protein [Undibacterium sp. 20NA77.5]WMW80937.1 hypothetical protein RF679_01325 [Undibacterium sp. 20NA77.5]
MATFTICYSGTDCYMDHGLVLRYPNEMASYNVESGYIPSKVHQLLSDKRKGAENQYKISTTLNGCGTPYNETCDQLPIRIWSEHMISDAPQSFDWEWECTGATRSTQVTLTNMALDSLNGLSIELIAIAGIAQMLNVTLHLVPKGKLDELREHWPDSGNMGYTLADLACPVTNKDPEVGDYTLRWSAADNVKIQQFLEVFDQVAIVGHSRGGVACIIASNYLGQFFPSLKLKILTLDPVPGPGNWWEVLAQIPAMENMEYIGIYAIDETSSGFNAVVPRVREGMGTQVKRKIWDPLASDSNPAGFIGWSAASYKLIYTRGRHATIPGSNSRFGQGEKDPHDDDIGSCGRLVFSFVVDQLIRWGVPLSPIDKVSVKKWLTQTLNAADKFTSMRAYTYEGWLAKKANMFFYYDARGISSSSGPRPSEWQYLEAYITQSAKRDPVRGLIIQGIYDNYYKTCAGTGTVHPWAFLGDILEQD